MKSLQEWYRYLEEQTRKAVAAREAAAGARPAGPAPGDASGAIPAPGPGAAGRQPAPRPAAAPPVEAGRSESPSARRGGHRPAPPAVTRQERLPIEMPQGTPARRRGGRRPLTESREEIIQRLLDPELSLHEAAAVLNLSKATLRRYTDRGRLPCLRTAGRQRRFRLSDLLAFLERAEGAP